MDECKFSGFSDEEKRLSQCALVPVVDDEPAQKITDDSDYKIKLVLDGFFRAALTEGQISEVYGIDVVTVCAILSEYSRGLHGTMRFSPQFHDRVVEYFWSHPEASLKVIDTVFNLRENVCGGIVSGRYYTGCKYDKATVSKRYLSDPRHRDRKPSVRKSTTSAEIIEALRGEIDELKSQKERLEDLVSAMSSRHEVIVLNLADLLQSATKPVE